MQKVIVIKKGQNWPLNDPMLPTMGTIWKRSFVFTNSCLYPIKGYSYGINKLWGISGMPYHKRNSVRVCWLPTVDGKAIQLYATSYVNGVREIRKSTIVKPGDVVDCLISNQGNNASVCINGVCTTFKVRIPFVTYMLKVYFGGIPAAPQDIYILRESKPQRTFSFKDLLTRVKAFFGVGNPSMEELLRTT
jgi:hypothetical protein